MTAEEIREIAMDSADNYYNYLSENDRGTQIVDVQEIEYIPSKDIIIKLRLSAKLFDVEAVFFQLLTNNKKYDTSTVKIIEYDNDKNILLVKIIPDLMDVFKSLRPNDIKVISDLKFLIERVKTWYELNGSKVSIPSISSVLSNSFTKIKYLKGLTPSLNQTQALINVFSNPFSYIWGAPGTGKTQYVLAYAILHYINNGKRVAIVAPTNNAIEQVLRGVLKMTDSAGIDRKKIIRLGTPTRKFADDYPEVCEERGIQKRLEEIDKQIEIISAIINFASRKFIIVRAKQKLSLFTVLEMVESSYLNSKEEFEKARDDLKKQQIEIEYLNKEVQNKIQNKTDTLKSIDSFFYKIKRIISSGPTKEEIVLIDLDNSIIEKSKQADYLKYKLAEVEKGVKDKEELYNSKVSLVNGILNEIKESCELIDTFSSIISSISIANWRIVKDKLNQSIEVELEKVDSELHMKSEYDQYSTEELIKQLDFYKASRFKLSSSSTQERVKSVNVVACTLDGYIGRYSQEKLNVDHIFLDEAGYANIIKSLTLFNNNIPITFLGDHKQLPPVCEINDLDIQRNAQYHNVFLWSQSAIFLSNLFTSTRDVCLLNYVNNAKFDSTQLVRSSLTSTYRFGSNLARILASHVYENNFISETSHGETQISCINAKRENNLKSRISITEVNAIRKLTNQLKSQGIDDYIILTPYKNQVKLLGQHMPEERNNFKILTVHGSQGREWHTVILSVVDTSDKWFVDSTIQLSKGLNLVNTAVSRAQKRLIIVCDKNYWSGQQNQLLTDLINSGNELVL